MSLLVFLQKFGFQALSVTIFTKNVTNIINPMKNRAYCGCSLFQPEGL